MKGLPEQVTGDLRTVLVACLWALVVILVGAVLIAATGLLLQVAAWTPMGTAGGAVVVLVAAVVGVVVYRRESRRRAGPERPAEAPGETARPEEPPPPAVAVRPRPAEPYWPPPPEATAPAEAPPMPVSFPEPVHHGLPAPAPAEASPPPAVPAAPAADRAHAADDVPVEDLKDLVDRAIRNHDFARAEELLARIETRPGEARWCANKRQYIRVERSRTEGP
jgi:hypothetical protein